MIIIIFCILVILFSIIVPVVFYTPLDKEDRLVTPSVTPSFIPPVIPSQESPGKNEIKIYECENKIRISPFIIINKTDNKIGWK